MINKEQTNAPQQATDLGNSLPQIPRDANNRADSETLLKVTKEAIGSLENALQAGKSDTLVAYLEAMSRFHQYSFGNVILIFCQQEDATHVAGFHTWKKLGRHVRKGERGIRILAPIITKVDKEDADNDQNAESQPRVVRGFRAVTVFDISQTDGKELPGFAGIDGEVGDCLGRLQDFVRSLGIELCFEDHLQGADGVSEGGTIRIRNGLSEAEEFAVLVHEAAHEMLHKGERRADSNKTVRETEAEAVAYVVSRAIGLDCSTRSSDYIQLYQGTTETLSESLDGIQKTAATIISNVLSSVEAK